MALSNMDKKFPITILMLVINIIKSYNLQLLRLRARLNSKIGNLFSRTVAWDDFSGVLSSLNEPDG